MYLVVYLMPTLLKGELYTSFSNEYRAVNDNNIVCQACVRRWLPVHGCYWL